MRPVTELRAPGRSSTPSRRIHHRFTAGLRRDYDAVRAGLTLEHSSGRVEGAPSKRSKC
jgi:hypothetical protein